MSLSRVFLYHQSMVHKTLYRYMGSRKSEHANIPGLILPSTFQCVDDGIIGATVTAQRKNLDVAATDKPEIPILDDTG